MKVRSTKTPESTDRARFLDTAAAVAETTPAAVTLMLAAGLKRIARIEGSGGGGGFDERV